MLRVGLACSHHLSCVSQSKSKRFQDTARDMIFKKYFRIVILIVSLCMVSVHGSSMNCNETLLHTAARDGNLEYIEKAAAEDLYAEDCQGLTPMHVAILYGNIDFMVSLAEVDFDVNRLNGDALPILHYSVINGSMETTKVLLAIGSIPNAVNALMETPLYLSIQEHDEAVSKLLISSGANLHMRDLIGNTLAHAFVESKDLRALKLLEALNGELDAQNNFLETPLLIAVKNNSPSFVNFLVAKGVNITKLPYLHSALAANAYDALRALLENGISTQHETEDGQSVIEFAVKDELMGAVDILASFRIDRLSGCSFSKQIPNSIKRHDSDGIAYQIKDKDGNSVLHVSVKYGKIKIVRELLSKHGALNIDEEGEGGSTAMELAIRNNNADIMQILASFGADINRRNREKESLMKQAIISESNKAIEWLIDHGVSAVEKDEDGNTYLHVAVKLGKNEAIKALLSKNGSAIVDEEGEEGNTAMELAIEHDRTDIMDVLTAFGADIHHHSLSKGSLLNQAVMGKSIKAIVWLIDHGASREEKDIDGNTILHVAVKFGDIETIKTLLSKTGSAIVDEEGEEGNTAMELAIEHDRTDIMDVLTTFGADIHRHSLSKGSLLKQAVMGKSIKAIDWLIANGANHMEKDVDGNTILHVAVKFGDIETIKTLLSKNVSAIVDEEGEEGNTAMELAIEHDRTDIMEVLAFFGADIHRHSQSKGSLLMQAVMGDAIKAIVWLIDHGASREEKDVYGNTILHVAVKFGDIETIKTLLSKTVSAIVDEEGEEGNTAMELAIEHDRTDVMDVLTTFGADIHRHSLSKGSLLKQAVMGKSFKAIDWLIDNGANYWEKDIDGNTILHVAVKFGDIETIKTLLSKNVSAIVDEEGEEGNTAMELAIEHDRTDIMEVLAFFGADIHRHSLSKGSLLVQAVMGDSIKAIVWLIDHGASREEKDVYGNTILHVAVKFGDIETIKTLLSKNVSAIVDEEGGEVNTAMELAIEHDRTDVMDVLTTFGADIHRHSLSKESLLKQAVVGKSIKAIVWLIDHGASREEKDIDGSTILRVAVKFGDIETIKTLLSKTLSAIVDEEGEEVNTAMELAIEHDRTDVMDVLTTFGADIHRHSLSKGSLLKQAVMGKSIKAIDWLIDNGANYWEKDIDGNTILHVAVKFGDIETLRTLLSKTGSAIVDEEGEEGNTAMELAIEHDRTDIMDVLTTFGADIHRHSLSKGSLLKQAVMKKSENAIAWLIDHGADPEENDVDRNPFCSFSLMFGFC